MRLHKTAWSLVLLCGYGWASTIVQNPTFLTPDLSGGYQYRPVGADWTFSGSAGIASIAGMNTGFNITSGPDPQVGFIQVSTGMISQTLSNLTVGDTYEVDFFAATRPDMGLPPIFWGGDEDFGLYWNNTLLGTYQPDTTNFSEYGGDTFVPTTTSGVLAFEAIDSLGGDRSSFITDIDVEDTTIPEPGDVLLVSSGIGAIALLLRRKSRNSR